MSLVDNLGQGQADWPRRDLAANSAQVLRSIVGREHFLDSLADRYAYARDRLPYGLFRLRAGSVPGTLPAAVVIPGNEDELLAVVRHAQLEGLRLIPFGAGSGVLGGTVPLCHELVVDLKRFNRVLELNAVDQSVTVQAGLNGGQLEQYLAARGYSANHLPQSLHMSTVGGWAACRGAGQASSRYGNIEDIVIGLKAVLPDGQRLHVRAVPRRSVGPSIKDLLLGSEGVLGFITELTLRVSRKPEVERGLTLAFASLESAWDALRAVLQHEGRPSVMRIYDEQESRQRVGQEEIFKTKPILVMLQFTGPKRLADAEEQLALEHSLAHGATVASNTAYEHWLKTRFHSYSIEWQTAGYYMDTIEVACSWSVLPRMYAQLRQAVRALDPDIYFAAHWSHLYPQGACQYMTLRLPPMPLQRALELHQKAWDCVEKNCLALGGSMAHHHGVGLFRNPWLRAELNAGLSLLQTLKDGLDPQHLFNPGKLGLSPPAGISLVQPGAWA